MKSIFVSSTFQDMQAERDMMRQKVFPAINKAARSHNDHIEFIDLRWGIDTQGQSEQDASIKVMDVCLNELRRSDDLMIILLGDRYGWIPDEDYIEKLRIKHDISWEMDRMSATAFEIEQGVLIGNKKALVYIREIADPGQADLPDAYLEKDAENRRRLEKLKERLRYSPNCKVQMYSAHLESGKIAESDLNALSERIIADLKDIYAREWDDFDRLLDFDREQEIQWGFIERKARDFSARESELDSLVKTVQSWGSGSLPEKNRMRIEDHMHFIIGPSGSGKSTFISEIAVRLRKNGVDLLPFIGGLTTESSDVVRVLRGIIYYIEEQLGLEHQAEFGEQKEYEIKIEGSDKEIVQGYLHAADITLMELQTRLVKIAGEYAKDHRPLIVVIDALDQLYPDGNRDMWAFCPSGLKGNIRFLITCTPDIITGKSSKTFLEKLNKEERDLIVRSILGRRRKELSDEVISSLLKKEGANNPLYISMAIDRIMLMDQDDFKLIMENGGDSKSIALHQNEIIRSLPDGLSEMAVTLFDAAAEKIGQSFTQKAMQYFAVSRRGLRESDLAYCMEDEWNSADFSNLLYYLDDQFMMRTDGRIDFVHKILRQGVLSTTRKQGALHLKLEWCYHQHDIDDSVRASELLYHCYCRKDFNYAATVVRPIVYQNFSKDNNVLEITSKRYAQTIADLALVDQGEWVRKWLHALAEAARNRKKDDKESEATKWNKFWYAIWFLNGYVLDALPDTQSGNETGGSITYYMIEAADGAENGSITEESIESVKNSIHNKKARYLLKAGQFWEIRIQRKREFEQTRAYYESKTEKEYEDWCRMFNDSYFWLAVMKGSSDRNVLYAALEPAAYGIDLLSEKAFVDKHFYEEDCLIGELYGCIGEVCQNLGNYEANLLAYEQDLRYREEKFKRLNSAEALRAYSGSYHNIATVYWNIKLSGQEDFDQVYSGQATYFKDSKHPIKLLPVIRFTSDKEKTEGEKFMDRCHEQAPIVSSMMARNKQIELIEKAMEMNPDMRLNSTILNHDALWYEYLLYSVYYLEGLSIWNPTDAREANYYSSENIRLALDRLCKALKYSWECFFDDPTQKAVLNIMDVEDTIIRSMELITYDRAKVVRSFDQCLHKGEECLKACITRDYERYLDEGDNGELESKETKYARFIYVLSCIRSSKILIDTKLMEQEENIVLKWCSKVIDNLPSVKLWIDESDRRLITKSSGSSTDSDDISEFEREIMTCRSDCEQIRRIIWKKQRARK